MGLYLGGLKSEINFASAFACSKLTTETLNRVQNMFKVNNKDTRTTSVIQFVVWKMQTCISLTKRLDKKVSKKVIYWYLFCYKK